MPELTDLEREAYRRAEHFTDKWVASLEKNGKVVTPKGRAAHLEAMKNMLLVFPDKLREPWP